MPHLPGDPGFEDVLAARGAGLGMVRETPVLSSRTLSDLGGGTVVLKVENLQRTGSFKLRGALAKISALGAAAEAGVVTGSAGNHAQALAYAARIHGVPCEVVMPLAAPVSKVEAAAAYGATVVQVGESIDEAVAHARRRAQETGATFVHPFDDADVIAGQGTVGLELIDQVPDLAAAVIPVGGGGLASGVALAIRARRPTVRIVGVQAAAAPGALSDAPVVWPPVTLADGIAVKRPSQLTARLLARLVDEIVVVSESAIAEAISLMLSRAKLVVEGAGAVGVAALLEGAVRADAAGSTVVILSGGNIDPTTLVSVIRREETRSGRRLVLVTRVDDRPGHLAELLALVGRLGGNLLEVHHLRDGVDVGVRQTGIELVLETRGIAHSAELVRAVAEGGYAVDRSRAQGTGGFPAV